jgi:hypothetical protein
MSGLVHLRPGLCAALLALLAFGGPARAEDKPPVDPAERERRIAAEKKRLAEAEREMVERTNKAIDKGVDWLEKAMDSQGVWVNPSHPTSDQNAGRQALGVYCLLKCGASPKDKSVKKALEGYEKVAEKLAKSRRTYSESVAILLYDALAAAPEKPPKKGADEPAKPRPYPKAEGAEIEERVRWLLEKQAEQVWRYPGSGGQGGDQDLSNTMYACFALATADRREVVVPEEAWRKALEYLCTWQEEDGPDTQLWVLNTAFEPGGDDRYGRFMPGRKAKARGWAYVPRRDRATTGSMTTAGLFCLGVIRERLAARDRLDPETRKRIDASLLSGIAWMGARFDVKENPGQGGWHYYYLYGLERAGAALGLEHFGQHEWYPEGRAYLVEQQQADGSWPSPTESIVAAFEDPFLQTVFALLFLRRASAPPVPIMPVVTGE